MRGRAIAWSPALQGAKDGMAQGLTVPHGITFLTVLVARPSPCLPCRALECAEAVEELQPKQLDAGFLRLKLSLLAQDGPAAAQAVVQLAACEGATPDVMRVCS